MAFLTTGDWYQVTFLQTNDAAWGALGTVPGIPYPLSQYIVDGTSIMIRVLDAATGMFVFLGGFATGFDDTLIDTSSGPLTKNTWTTDDTVFYEYGLTGAATVYFYDSAALTLRSFSGAESTAMKAFLP